MLKIQLELLPSLVNLKLLSLLSFPCLTTSRERQQKGPGYSNRPCVRTQDMCPGERCGGFPWRLCELMFTDYGCLVAQTLLSFTALSLSFSDFVHGFQQNNSPAWLHHRLDMSPFLFVSFVTRRSACKVEYNILLSLSSQVSTLSFRRKCGHCTLNSHNLQPKFTITLSWAFLCEKISSFPAFVQEPVQSMGHPTTLRGDLAKDLERRLFNSVH